MKKYTFKDVANFLAQDVERVVYELLPQGERQNHEWCVGSIYGERGESLKIHLAGEKAGVWCDFATGEGGDLLELWRKVKKLSAKEALANAKSWLGIKDDFIHFSKFHSKPPKTFDRPTTVPQSLSPTSKVSLYLQNERKLTFETLQKYQVREYTHNNREVMVFPYIRDEEVLMNKSIYCDRPHGKKEMFTSKNAEPCLFGWHMIPQGARSIAIFEGEIDAMTGHQYEIKHFNPISKTREEIGMLSVPRGGGSGNKQEWVEYEYERLCVYDEIFLVMDADQVGQEACVELIIRLGRHRCSIVTLPCKDMNECLQKGISQEIIQKCFDEAKSLDPQELVSLAKYTQQIKDQFALNALLNKGITDGIENLPFSLGYLPPWGIEGSDLIFKPNELSLWTGINGHGKSQLLGNVILRCVSQGAKICIASLELKAYKLGERLYRQALGKRDLHEEEIDAISEYLENKLYLFDHVGDTNIEKLLEIFTYAHCRYGVDVFVIDSLMKCGILGDDYNQQKLFIDKLCTFKNTYNCHIHLVVHPRKSNNELSPPGKMDIKGSGDITDLADNCFSVWRNVIKEEKLQEVTLNEQERLKYFQSPDCIFKCVKRRDGEWSGQIALWFDRDSLQYLMNFNEQALALLEVNNNHNDLEEYEYGEI